MRAAVVALVAVLGLAACGGGGKKADLPAGQHDLGDGISVVVKKVVDPVIVDTAAAKKAEIATGVQPGTRWVAIDVEYHNDTDHVVDMGMAYGRRLHTSDGREAQGVLPTFTVPAMPTVPSAIPPHSFSRGWDVYEVPDGAKPTEALFYNAQVGDDPVVVDVG
jgi:hypothetical protein